MTTTKRPMPPTTQAGYWALTFGLVTLAVLALGLVTGAGPRGMGLVDVVLGALIWAGIGWVVGIGVGSIRKRLRTADQVPQQQWSPWQPPRPAPACPRCWNPALEYGQGYVGCRRCGWWTR